MKIKASEIFETFKAQGILETLTGPDNDIARIDPVETSGPSSLVFVDSPDFVDQAVAVVVDAVAELGRARVHAVVAVVAVPQVEVAVAIGVDGVGGFRVVAGRRGEQEGSQQGADCAGGPDGRIAAMVGHDHLPLEHSRARESILTRLCWTHEV